MAEAPGSSRRGLGIALGLALVLFVVAAFVISRAERSRSELPILAELPTYAATAGGQEADQGGNAVRLTIIGIGYQGDADSDPVVSERLDELVHAFEGSDRVRLASMMIARDGTGMYSIGPGDDEAGPVEAWQELRRFIEESDTVGQHRPKLVLIDGEGRVRGAYDARDEASLKTLKDHVRQLAQR